MTAAGLLPGDVAGMLPEDVTGDAVTAAGSPMYRLGFGGRRLAVVARARAGTCALGPRVWAWG